MSRVKIAEFGIIQKSLGFAIVTIYTANADGTSTGVKATIYQASSGTGTRENPQTLSVDGKLSADCYVDSAVVATIGGISNRVERLIRKITQNPLEYALPITTAKISSSLSAVTSVQSQTGDVVLNPDDLDDSSITNKFTDSDGISKLSGIEENADVTDTANVTSAGALMDSEVASLSGIKSLTVPDSTTITAFIKTLLAAASAAAARTVLGVYSTTEVDSAISSVPTGSLVLLETIVADDDATVEFTGFADDAVYDSYFIRFDGVYAAVNTASLRLTMSKDDGSTYLTTYRDSGTNSVSSITIASAFSDGAATSANGRVDIFSQDNAADYTAVLYETVHFTTSVTGALSETRGKATALTVGVVDAFKIFCSSGNITAGTFRIYGVKK